MPKTATKARPDLTGFVNTSHVAERYGVTQREVQRAIKDGRIYAQQVGYFYLIWEEDLPKSWPSPSDS